MKGRMAGTPTLSRQQMSPLATQSQYSSSSPQSPLNIFELWHAEVCGLYNCQATQGSIVNAPPFFLAQQLSPFISNIFSLTMEWRPIKQKTRPPLSTALLYSRHTSLQSLWPSLPTPSWASSRPSSTSLSYTPLDRSLCPWEQCQTQRWEFQECHKSKRQSGKY
jgi:hypothetical protein